MADLRPAILLDRDGTVIVEKSYLADPAEVELAPGAGAGLRHLAAVGFTLVVVSNQSGIARGLMTEADVGAVNGRAAELLRAEGVEIAGWYHCPHGPDAGCTCRKPAPGLAHRAARDLGLDLTRSVVVGDKPSDIALGDAVGAGVVLVLTGHGSQSRNWARENRIPVAADLNAAAALIGNPMVAGLASTALRARAFLRQEALPLWSTAGFDSQADSFEERLEFDLGPDPAAPRRLMVQARQIAVFARAALDGDFPAGADLARRAGRAMVINYLSPDGQPGWVFSVDRAGRVLDTTLDLYAHAFTLFALAWLKRLDGGSEWDTAIAATLDVLDTRFAHPRGGFHESLPRRDAVRRQNPHMHLFEALIELATVDRSPATLARCHALDRLARSHFIDGLGGVHEQLDADWNPAGAFVEPGHQMEWAWLLGRYAALVDENRTTLVDALVVRALATGIDAATGRAVDLCDPAGTVLRATSRSWPHAEAAKALADQIRRGRLDYLPAYRRVVERLLDRYCPLRLEGGWLDQFDADDRPLSTFMPASSLYHVYFGLKSLDTLQA